MTVTTERCANLAMAEYSDTTKRFARSTDTAFACERYQTVNHYVSRKYRHRIGRFIVRLVRWLTAPKP